MYLKVGTILKEVGLKGDVRIYSTTTFEKERFKVGNTLFIFNNENYLELKIKFHKKIDNNIHVLNFENYDTIEKIKPFIKKDLLILKDDKILKENEFFYSDLIGCDIYFENNKIGIVDDVKDFTNKISLEVKLENKKILYIPFIDVFIKNVDINNKKIDVNLIEGML